MKIQTFFFLIIGCCLPWLCFSQTVNEYNYGYDESGNRILREIIMKKSAQLPVDSLTSAKAKVGEASFKELFGEKQITITPNPTKGLITVQIPLSEMDNVQIALYDLRGGLLLEYKNVGSITAIDLSNEPPGTYLMRIFINNKPSTWKIIRQN